MRNRSFRVPAHFSSLVLSTLRTPRMVQPRRLQAPPPVDPRSSKYPAQLLLFILFLFFYFFRNVREWRWSVYGLRWPKPRNRLLCPRDGVASATTLGSPGPSSTDRCLLCIFVFTSCKIPVTPHLCPHGTCIGLLGSALIA